MAIEAIKPASGFIQALLGPKIEKLKLWVNEKELQGKLDTQNLSKVMKEYLEKLSYRVSEITSISFPLLKLSIFEAYEPLNLERVHLKGEEDRDLRITELFDGNNKAFILIDSAGMGKSTFSKYLITQLLYKSDRIPIFFELRKINEELDLIENLVKELDFPGNPFDRKLFYKLLELGKFVVIIDGFDEVSLDYQEEISNQIHNLSVKGGNNILILTSRPQDTLPDLVNGMSLRFKVFTIHQAKSLLQKYDAVSKLDVGQRLINEIDNVPAKFIESPLLVSLLYRTFGVNNSIADRICTFYDEIYDALYKGHDLINKNGYGREKKSALDFEDFRKLLRALCYYMMLNRKTSFESRSEAIKYIDKAATISSMSPTSSYKYLDDLLVAVPLMQREGSEFKFFHKTILEYFAAEYLVYDKASSKLVEKIFNSKLASSFEKVFEFLSDINSSLFDAVITYHFAKLAPTLKQSDTLCKKVLSTLSFVKDCKIGLWLVSEHSYKHDGRPYLSHTVNDADDSFNSITWNIVEVDGLDYFMAITFTDFRHNLHAQAWDAISEESSYEIASDNKNTEKAKQLADIIGVNQWVDINEEVIKKIDKNNVYLHLAMHVIQSNRGRNEVLRIISSEKVQSVIMRVKTESELEKEMESLLVD
jgi:hypothetical protein